MSIPTLTPHQIEKLTRKAEKYIKLLDKIKNVDIFYAETKQKVEASLFLRELDSFVRISTTLIAADGANAQFTRLDQNTEQYKNLLKNETFIGPTLVFGKPYFTVYQPFWTSGSINERVLLITFIGIPL